MTTLYLIIVLLILMIPNLEAFMYQNGVVLPIDPYVYIGRNLTLTCNLTRALDEDSRSMFFTRKANQEISSKFVQILSTRSIRLRLPIESGKDGGNYVCKIRKTTGDIEVVANQIVTVEYFPQKVKAIICRVKNWEQMTCIWSLGVNYVHPDNIKVELVWAVSGDRAQYDCPRLTNTSCMWVKDTTKDRFRADMMYTMGIVVSNNRTNANKSIDQATSDMFQIDTSRIVQPASVTDLRYTSNNTCMTLTWNHSAALHKKVYRIQYEGDGNYSNKKKIISEVKHQRYTDCNLKPNAWYRVKVACRPLHWDNTQTGYWSEEKALSVHTMEDVPQGAPGVLEGSYTVHHCSLVNCRTVIIYWKPVDYKESNGVITNYRLTKKDLFTHQESIEDLGNVTSKTLSLDKSRSYWIKIQAATKIGLSSYASKLVIPLKDNQPHHPADFIVERNKDSFGKQVLEMQWKAPKEVIGRIVSYTLYWCEGYHGIRRCMTPIQWKILPPTLTKYTMSYKKMNWGENMLLGISMEEEGKNRLMGRKYSSGILWNKCIFEKNSKPHIAPRNFRLSPHEPENSIKVEWDEINCHETKAYINVLTIYYCLIDENKNCTGPTNVIETSSKATNLVISDLDLGHDYKFWMEAESLAGKGPQTASIYANIPFKLQTEEIAGIIVAVFFVFALAMCGVICCVKRCYHTVKQKFKPYEIVVPNISLPSMPMPNHSSADFKSKEEDEESIYAKIDEENDLSDLSVPGSTSVVVPLLIKDSDASPNKTPNYGQSSKENCMPPSDCGQSKSYNHGNLRNSMESFLSRLNYNIGSTGSEKVGSKKIRKKNSSLTNGVTFVKKPTSNPEFLRDSCNPYSCVDLLDTKDTECDLVSNGKSEKEIHSEGNLHCDQSYGTNDLSLVPASLSASLSIPWKYQLQNNVTEQFNIKHSLDRRKNILQECCNNSEISNELNCSESCENDATDTKASNLEYEEPVDRKSYECDVSTPSITSYSKFANDQSKTLSPYTADNLHDVCSKSLTTRANEVPNGYVGHDQIQVSLTPPKETVSVIISGQRPVSEVVNLPPHFYGSLSLLDDNGAATEL